jgi:hypothetical protein
VVSKRKKTYRVYRLDGVLKIVHVDEVEADGDDDAVARVRESNFGLKCEIWDGHRMVAKLENAER